MNLVPIIVVVALIILVVYFLMNKKSDETDREGAVRAILKKDAISVDFGDGRPVVVKLHGIIPATEAEMLDDKIFAFLEESLRGKQVVVKPVLVESQEVMSAEVRTQAGEYVNAALVRIGFARWSASAAGSDKDIADAQTLAQTEQVGVWNPAIIQLIEDKKKSAESQEVTDDDIANLTVEPDSEEEKR